MGWQTVVRAHILAYWGGGAERGRGLGGGGRCRVMPYISLGHPFGANTEQICNFSGFSHVLVQCTKISFRRGGGVCVCFLKSVRKGRFRNVWVGGGGEGGHSFAQRAVNGRTHRAQTML